MTSDVDHGASPAHSRVVMWSLWRRQGSLALPAAGRPWKPFPWRGSCLSNPVSQTRDLLRALLEWESRRGVFLRDVLLSPF